MTNLTEANITTTTQVTKYANHLETKGSDMVALTSTIDQIQGEIKTPKRKINDQNSKGTGAT